MHGYTHLSLGVGCEVQLSHRCHQFECHHLAIQCMMPKLKVEFVALPNIQPTYTSYFVSENLPLMCCLPYTPTWEFMLLIIWWRLLPTSSQLIWNSLTFISNVKIKSSSENYPVQSIKYFSFSCCLHYFRFLQVKMSLDWSVNHCQCAYPNACTYAYMHKRPACPGKAVKGTFTLDASSKSGLIFKEQQLFSLIP